MDDLPTNLDDLKLDESVFIDVKYYISGHVSEKVLDVLRLGGAERMNYFSDYVTHLICGHEPDENDITDATDVYEIPVVTIRWVVTCAKLKKKISPKGFRYDLNQLFSGMIFCFSKIRDDRNALWSIISYNGGNVQHNLTASCTHLVTSDLKTSKYLKAFSLNEKIKIITIDWILESVKNKSLAQYDIFHPKLLTWPKPRESTALITGFEQDDTEKVSDIPETESTQALLDQLKQRMPWNQPSTPTTTSATNNFQNFLSPSSDLSAAKRLPWTPVAAATSNANTNNTQFNFNLNTSNNNTDNKRLPWNQQSITPNQPPPPFPTQPNSQAEVAVKSSLFTGIVEDQQQQSIQHQSVQQQQQSVQQQQQQLFQQQRVQQIRTSLAQQSQQFLNSKPNISTQNTFNQQVPQQQQQQMQQIQTMQSPINQQQGQVQANRQFLGQNQPHLVQNTQQAQFKIGQPPVQNVQGHLPGQQTGNQISVIPGQQMIHNQSQLVQNQLNQVRMTTQQGQIPFQNQQVVTSQQQVQFPLQQQVQQVQQVQQQVPFGPRGPVVQEQIPFSNQNQIQINQMGQNQIYQQQQQPNQNQVPHQFLQQKVQQRPQLHPNWQQQQLQQQQQQQLNPQLTQQQQMNPQQINAAQQLQQQQQQQRQQQLAAQQQLGPQPHLVQQQLAQQQPNQQLIQQQTNQQQLLQQQQQMGVRHPNAIGAPRLNWSPNQTQAGMPQRQLIHLDAQTHQQLQQMDPQQRALFVQKIQRQRQLLLQQRQQQIIQQQQRGGHIAVIRSSMPPGLTPQQQMQWIQQQQQQQQAVAAVAVAGGKPPQVVLPPGHAPGLSPIAQPSPAATPGQVVMDQNQQLQRQQFQRLQQLQMQREQAQKQQQLQQQQQQQQQQAQQVPTTPAALPVRPPALTAQETPVAVAGVAAVPGDAAAPTQQQLVVNAKTKTALANMLSIRLQSGGANIPPGTGPVEQEPSAAGTLRLMTAQHNASLNPPARPQDLLALQQPRRTLGNITNAAGVPTPTVAAGADPTVSKQFTPATPGPPGPPPPGRVLAPQQHRHGPFYGHNPNLKLPPDLFLLGCIFVVVEVERYLEETSPDWRTVVERHGGEIEPVYCSRVTHVICETQRHGVVMQALRDFKRCVTLFWLEDVLQRRQVLPPWQALHLPTGYMDGAPATRHLISLSGFIGNDRYRVRDMIKYTGAKYTSYFSRHNTLLVSARAEGDKWQHAKKWGTPIVSLQWLTDLMLGNLAALQQLEHVKYQQFAPPGQSVQFGFDASLVPNLMFAWKMPINISQESYERVKRSPPTAALSSKPKKPKLEPQPITSDESDIPATMENSTTHRILFSFFNEKDRVTLENIVKKLGGVTVKSYTEATHLVMPELTRSLKLLFAISAGLQIVPESWLQESSKENKFLDTTNYKFDAKDFNTKYNCDFYVTLQVQNRDKLFANKVFYLTPSVCPSYKELKGLIEQSGGIVEKQRRSLQQIESANNTVPYSYIIITAENDLHLVFDCLRKGDKMKFVNSSELIMNAILNQKISFDPYLVRCC